MSVSPNIDSPNSGADELSALEKTSGLEKLLSPLAVKITRLSADSRAIQAGDTFLAYPGTQADGRQHIELAIKNGANAVIWEAQNFTWNSAWDIPNLPISNLRHHAGNIASYVYGAPSSKLWMIGITGTNGKTSCAHWLAYALHALGTKTALIGTLGNGFHGALQPTSKTTPDAVLLHQLLAQYWVEEARAVTVEVSSHALQQGRVNGVKFDVALLTNLSRDHLDYHGNMRNYAAAKARLFEWPQLKYAVLNLDDSFGADMAWQLRDKAVEVIGYGMSDAALGMAERFGLRMVYGSALQISAQGLRLQVHSSWGGGTLHSTLLGRFNASNLLGVLATLLVSGIALDDALREMANLQAVAGRLQTFGGDHRPTIVIDYAHTPDALEKVLQTLREVMAGASASPAAQAGKLICVFGCGGNRDAGKRPIMGAIAARLADVCIVTSDNPRAESPQAIIAAIVTEMAGKYQIIEDRTAAIGSAIHSARAIDTVLVAGKGHEDYQEIHGIKHPFNDMQVAQHALQTWGAKAHPLGGSA